MSPAPTPPSADASASRLARITILMSLVASLAACGGGGGGGSDSSSPPPPPPPPPPPSSAGPYTITGTATYQSVPPNNGGSLNYNAQSDKPIRGATVQLLAVDGSVLSTTTTDTAGAYSVVLPTSRTVTVRVRAEIKSATRDVQVVDNTGTSTPLYVLDSAPFAPTADTTQNVRAASGWGGSGYTSTRAAAPFAILDTIYAAQAKIASVSPVTLPALKVNWSVNNKPTSPFNPGTGAIGTTFFTSGSSGRQIYVLGAANTDTDEYDSHVIAHEYGHYLQNTLSRDDSVGGSHGSGDKLDLRVAFSEGWGNAWSGIALGGPRYTDSYGTNQSNGFVIDVSQPASGADRGPYSETTAQYLIWTTNTNAGFTPLYTALTSLAASPTFTTLYSFGSAVKAGGYDATALWASQNIVLNDAYGTGETNNGGNAVNLPVYKVYSTLGTTQNYCVNTTNDGGNDGNKLGEYAYVRFTASGAHTITVAKTSSTGTTDPDFTLVTSTGAVSAAESSTADLETLTVTLPTGTHVIALSDYNLVSPNTSCFDFKVQ